MSRTTLTKKWGRQKEGNSQLRIHQVLHVFCSSWNLVGASMRKWRQTANQTHNVSLAKCVQSVAIWIETEMKRITTNTTDFQTIYFQNNLSLWQIVDSRQMKEKKKVGGACLLAKTKQCSYNLHNCFTHMLGWLFLTVCFGEFNFSRIVWWQQCLKAGGILITNF